VSIGIGTRNQGNSAGASVNSFNATIDASAQIGDVVVLSISQNGTQAITSVTSPGTGAWQLRETVTTSGSNCRLVVYTKKITAGDPGANIAVALAGSQRIAWSTVPVTGAKDYDVSAQATNNTQTSSLIAPTVNATKPNSMLITSVAARNGTNGVILTFTSPGGTTEQADTSTTAGAAVNSGHTAGSRALTSAGATGTTTFTPSAVASFAAASIVISPTPVQGAAALSAHGDLTAAGKTVIQAAAAMTGHADLGTAGKAVEQGASAMSAHGDLAATAHPVAQGGTSLTGHGDLTATGDHVVQAGAALGAHGDLAATGDNVIHAAAGMSTHGDLTAEASPSIHQGAVALTATGNLLAAANVPHTFPPDLLINPLTDFVLTCLCTTLAAHPNPIPAGRCCHRVGDHVTFGVTASGENECCPGLAWSRVILVAPTSEASFPNPDGYTIQKCSVRSWTVHLELGVARCAPVGDPYLGPTCDQWQQLLADGMLDAMYLRQTVCCIQAEQKYRDLVVLSMGTAGPTGLCASTTLTIAVKLVGCDEC